MADWTANSGFGATRDRGTVRRAEPVLRPARDSAQAPRAEGLAATRDWEEPAAAPKPRAASGAAALAQYNATLEGPLAKARLAVWAGGGALSFLLIAGVGIWGYKLVLREVMGLPVIAAEEGPMRVVPADPGGEVVPQQGFAVNAIPGAGTAAPPSDVLMLAPQAPGLAEEDMQVVQTDAEEGEVMPAAIEAAADPLLVTEAGTVAAVDSAAEPVTAAPTQAPESATATLAAAATAVLDPNAAPAEQAQQAARLVASLLPADRALTAQEILALADQVAAGSQPLSPLAAAAPVEAAVAVPAADATATTALEPAALAASVVIEPGPAEPAPAAPALAEPAPAAPALAVIAATVPGPSAAPVPKARPATLRPASAAPSVAAPAAAATATAPAEAAPVAEAAAPASAAPAAPAAAAPAGTHLIQLGAFDSAEIAASEWARFQSAHPEFLGGREHVVQEVQSGGRTLYRLRALGFPERADARILCAALTAEGTDCIPVTVD